MEEESDRCQQLSIASGRQLRIDISESIVDVLHFTPAVQLGSTQLVVDLPLRSEPGERCGLTFVDPESTIN